MPSYKPFQASSKEHKALIVDNWQDLGLNEESRAEAFRQMERWADKIILLADNWYQLEEFTSAVSDGHYAVTIDRLVILPYSPLQRTNMIQRWITLGREETQTEAERIYAVDFAERHLDEMTAAGMLPKYPLHILAALQAQQAIQQSDPDMGSQGYLYDTLVDRTLKAMSADVPEMTINRQFVSLIAGEMFDTEQQEMTIEPIVELSERFFREYAIRIETRQLLDLLVEFRMLKIDDGNYAFRERYVYYYFIAEYYVSLLQKRIGVAEAINKLKMMAAYPAYEEYAQIVMFVIYKTRNLDLIEEVIINSGLIFENAEICELDSDMDFVKLFQATAPTVTLPSGKIEDNRLERRRTLREEDEPAPQQKTKVLYSGDLDEGAKLQYAFKSLQMLGRILRNFPGQLGAETKRQLATACFELGLRTLTMLSEGVRGNVADAKAELMTAIREQSPNLDEQVIKSQVDQVLTFIVVGSSIVLVNAISNAIGSPKLRETYRQVGQALQRTPATDLINVAVELENFPEVPMNTLIAMSTDMENKFVAYQVLRYLVWKRLVYLPLESRINRQKLCTEFNIKASPQMISAKAS